MMAEFLLEVFETDMLFLIQKSFEFRAAYDRFRTEIAVL
jgi:hypothetical protein